MWSEPHTVVPAVAMSATEARNILALIERGAQATLNGLSVKYGVATARFPPDAATIVRRMRNRAEGVLQQEHRFEPAVR